MSEFSERLKISEKMADIIISAPDYLYTWMEGSAQCGKSVTAALAFALLIENAPKEDNLFLALGYTQSSAMNNVFECGGFGLIHYFGPKCRMCKYKGPSGKLKTAIDALEISTKTGKKIVVPFGTNTKTANNAWHGWRVAGFLFDEIDRACEESITEMQQRITAVDNPHIIVTQNPNVPAHPVYKILDNLLLRNLVNYSHWILDDNIGLTPQKIQEVKDRYDPNSIFYRRYVMGERVDAEGQIYHLRDYNILDSFDYADYHRFLVIADPGENASGTAFLLAGLFYNEKDKQNEMHILKEYFHRNADIQNRNNPKLPKDYAYDYCMFIKEIYNDIGRFPEAVLIDEDITFYRELVQQFRNFEFAPNNIKYVIKKEIEERIKTCTNLLYRGKLRFYRGCKKTIEQFNNDRYDSSKSEKGIFVRFDNPLISNIDCVDATEYLASWWIKLLYI